MDDEVYLLSSALSFTGWIPSQILWRDGIPSVQWVFLGAKRLLDPFYEQTLQREMSKPFQQLFQRESSIDELQEWAEKCKSLPLKGLIFHMSRCGSTLISQMLAAPTHHLVLSEPSPLDQVLRAATQKFDLPRETHVNWIRALVAALGQERGGEENSLFIKLDCWHVHQADLLREAFPDVPFLFLYREPLEVMVSHTRMPAAWTVPGILHPMALRLGLEDWDPQRMEIYCAHALANICEGGLALSTSHAALLVNYSELPQAMFGRIAQHFHLCLADTPIMLDQSYRDAKTPSERFIPDALAKRAAATGRLQEATATYLEPLYEQLESSRMLQLR